MKRGCIWPTILALAALASGAAQLESVLPGKAPEPLGQRLFASGEGSYHTFRIPALAVTTKGTVLAFCEGRRNSAGRSASATTAE